ncbi:MAG: hypothetical protein KJZ65_01670 [Phycisphaerales bacterium]|nr:hypothetical protein [Phycisphaerales bacterium]
MLFNTYIFLFAFLPVTLIGYFVLTARDRTRPAAIAWLVLTSLFYYGYWEPRYLVLMGISIILNYCFGLLLGDESRPVVHRRAVLALGTGINLALLGYYKYAGFAVDTFNTVLGLEFRCRTSCSRWRFPSSPFNRSPIWSTPTGARRGSTASPTTACS